MSFSFSCTLDPSSSFLSTLKVHSTCTTPVTDVNDSLRLESFFLQQALSTCHAAKQRLLHSGIPFTRPPTYHAHALKTGAHLLRIKQLQQKEQEAGKAREEARKQRQLKKEAVQVQRAREEERMRERKETMRMGKEMSGAEVAAALESGGNRLGKSNHSARAQSKSNHASRAQSSRSAVSKASAHPKNLKRQFKNQKFGFGGKEKKFAKRNTRESVNDASGFSVKKMKTPFGGRFGKGNGQGKGKGKRFGKK